MFEYLPLGRYLYVLGASPRAAELNGISAKRYVTLGFVAAGTLAAFAGVVLQSQLQVGQSSVGQEYLLPAFTAALLGATSIRPGRVNVWGTVLAVAVLAVTVAGLNQLGAPFFVEPLFNGSMLILAVGLAVQAVAAPHAGAAPRPTGRRAPPRPPRDRDSRRSCADEPTGSNRPTARRSPVLGRDWFKSRWGRGRPARQRQPDDAGQGAGGGEPDPDRRDRQPRQALRGEDADRARPRLCACACRAGRPAAPMASKSRTIWNDEFIATEIGQIGTQMDALGHLGCMCGAHGDKTNMLFYNGNRLSDMWSPYGLKKLGMENAPPFFTRGVLFDVQGLKGRVLDVGEEIKLADLKACLERQGVAEETITPGDAVFVRTGHGSRWYTETATFYDGAPGIGLECARWFSEPSRSCVVGADNFAVEVVPPVDPEVFHPCHQHLIMENGIHLHEGMTFEGLVERDAWVFAYVFAPLPIVGATGSPGNPIAVL